MRIPRPLLALATVLAGLGSPVIAQVSSAPCWESNLGANLADATGGDYNRRPVDLSDLLADPDFKIFCELGENAIF